MKWYIKEFKDLSVNELYEIVKSRFEVFVCGQKIDEQDFDDVDKKCAHIFYVDNDRVVAYSRIIPKGISYDAPSIGRVLVLDSYRRRGLAVEMMNRAIEYIKDVYKEKEIILSAQEYVVALYKSVGFEEISEVYLEAGIPHKKMKKYL